MHLAEFNFGTLKYPFDDPRIADFQNNIERVNAIAERSPGFIWRVSDEEMEAVQEDPTGPLCHRPNTASTLSVWSDAPSLYQFVEKTLHAHFMKRGAEWFKADDRSHLVMWWIEEGARPTVADAMQRWETLQAEGPGDHGFGGAELKRLATEAAPSGLR